MYRKNTVGYILSIEQEKQMPPQNPATAKATKTWKASGFFEPTPAFQPEDKPPEIVPVPDLTDSPAEITPLPIFSTELQEKYRGIASHPKSFFSYLSLQALAHQGCAYFVYLNQESENTCETCRNAHGKLFSLEDVKSGEVALPQHPNCRCTLVALDSAGQTEYALDETSFLGKLLQMLGKNQGLYRYQSGKLTWEPGIQAPAETPGTDWTDSFREWSRNFGADAQALFDAFVQAANERDARKFNDIPSFFDYVTLGIISGFFNANSARTDAMLNDPNVFSVLNWLFLGIPEMVEGAVAPKEPFSLQHWVDSFGTATLLVGVFQLSSSIKSGTKAPSGGGEKPKPEQIGRTELELKYIPSSGATLEVVEGRTTTVLGRYKGDIKDLIDEINYPNSYDFGDKPGKLNILNVPKGYDPDRFWDEYNIPFLEEAVKRKDIIKLVTEPIDENMYLLDRTTGKPTGMLTGFGKEIQYLESKGYVYDDVLKQMVIKE